MDYGYNYATDFRLQGIEPTSGGEDPYAGMCADCIYGALPIADAPQWAGQVQLDMNFGDYTPNQIAIAQKNLMKGVRTLAYDQIIPYIQQTGWGVKICYQFYQSFLTTDSTGILKPPSGDYSNHCSVIWGQEAQGLTINPLLGNTFGDNGYIYMTEDIYNASNAFALAYDPDANAFISRALIALKYMKSIPDVLKVINLP
jgi:hypothetical protein